MSPHDLVQLDHRGINLRLLASWQDGDGGPVDGLPKPGIVRIKTSPGDVWDLSGEAAERFRVAIREAAWTPGRDPAPPGGSVDSGLGQADNVDPLTGDNVDPPEAPDAKAPNGRLIGKAE